ncbi:ankyrin repeat domain-containing protein [Altibacter sp. HG106]|uniref:ankyrin repeat domain-containing protein n=1 Tax=Altibacter sp. HG106 TaxID=3023937 RepID=UPI00234FE4C8|nr:ankyrin repeat domain-containing protein [Altibacter sp. HG106]MDC7994199.1 ankyrin repeat domain-containing protein [Altibacter sp. HG106]
MKLFPFLFGCFFMVTAIGFGQTENIFLNRSFWKQQPDLEMVQQKVAEGHDPTAMTPHAFDAVIYALLEKNDPKIIKYLLSFDGNPIDKNTHDSRNYLHWASYAGTIETVKHLLDSGISVTKRDSHGYTPLAFAANAGQINPALYEAFENHGVLITEETNEHGANVLLLVAPSLSNETELNYFLNKGFDLHSTDADGNGIFNYAARKGSIDFLKLLVEKGVSYKTTNKVGGNAFLFAAQGTRGHENSMEIYRYLQGLGIDPNIVTEDGYTPLHRLAYASENEEVIKFFLTKGADVMQADEDGNTPFLNAASRNSLNVITLLAKHATSLEKTNKKGQNALMLATQNNQPEVVSYLLQQPGGKKTVQAVDADGNNLAYYWVASYNPKNLEAFQQKQVILQQNGVDFTQKQAENNTLLHLAAGANDADLLRQVASFNLPVDAKNDNGLTALHIAAMRATNEATLKLLLALGADASITTDFEETALDLAQENELLQSKNVSLNFLK